MKGVVLVAALMGMSLATANPYVEFKSKAKKIKGDSYAVSYFTDDATNHFRLGYEGKSAYFEAGKMTSGVSTEAGYKFKFKNGFTVKGKVESTNVDSWEHSFETEVRYTFK